MSLDALEITTRLGGHGGTPLAEALLTLNHLQSPWLSMLNEFHPQ